MKINRPRVVIIGAGFGGLWAARALANVDVEVCLVDRQNYHTFLPLLYQVAAAEVEPEEIVYPVRNFLRKSRNARFYLADVQSIDFNQRLVHATELDLPYDYLVLGIGSRSNYFGVPGAAEASFPLRTLEQGITLRNQILSCYERATQVQDVELHRRLLSFVIVGGGPTGVEFAGSLAELVHGPMPKDYPDLDPREVKVILIESRSVLLPFMPQKLGDYALTRLTQMGVDVRLNIAVKSIAPGLVTLGDESTIPADTLIWTAGMRGGDLPARWDLPTRRNGQVEILETLQVPDLPEVYVVGDLAYFEQDGDPLPMIAPVAIQQGKWAAHNILQQIAGAEPQPFRYRDMGKMVTIGRNKAATQLGRYLFTGFPAWLLWLGVHIYNLIGFRNRLFVMVNWAVDYIFYERTVRLILPRWIGQNEFSQAADRQVDPSVVAKPTEKQ